MSSGAKYIVSLRETMNAVQALLPAARREKCFAAEATRQISPPPKTPYTAPQSPWSLAATHPATSAPATPRPFVSAPPPLSPSQHSPPAHPAQKGIRPVLPAPNRIAGNPHRTRPVSSLRPAPDG